jgi:periplasmic protein TonB
MMKQLTRLIGAFGIALFVTAQAQAQTTTQATEAVLKTTEVDQVPTFPGGEAELMKFLVGEVKYPATAARDNAQGTIKVAFTVKTDGTLTSIYHAGHPETDNRLVDEAMRVVKAMPNWNPAIDNGQKVACQVVLPIQFKL